MKACWLYVEWDMMVRMGSGFLEGLSGVDKRKAVKNGYPYAFLGRDLCGSILLLKKGRLCCFRMNF